MYDKRAEALLNDFRSIADSELSDLAVSPELRDRIINACAVGASAKSEEKVRKFRIPMSLGTVAAAAAILLVAVLGGTKMLLGPKAAPQEFDSKYTVSGEAAPAALPEAAPESDELLPFAMDGVSEDSAPIPEPEEYIESEMYDEDAQTPEYTEPPITTAETPAQEPRAPQSGNSPGEESPTAGTGEAEDGGVWDDGDTETADEADEVVVEQPAEDAPVEEPVLGIAATSEADEPEEAPASDYDIGDNEILDEGVHSGDAHDGEAPESGASNNSTSGSVPPSGVDTLYDVSGAALYITGRATKTEHLAVNLTDGTAATWEQALEQIALNGEEQEIEDIYELDFSQGYALDGWYFARVLTITVDLRHWGEGVSPGSQLKAAAGGDRAEGEQCTLLLSKATEAESLGLYDYAVMYDVTLDSAGKEALTRALAAQ